MPTTVTFGWAFNGPTTLAAVKERLDAHGSWPCVWGDSHRLGDYLALRLTPEAIARIYRVEPGFVVNLRFYSEQGDVRVQAEQAKQSLLQRVLPWVEALDVRSVDPTE